MYVCNTYIHTYIHTYVRTYVRTYIHTYINTCVYTYIHAYKQANKQTSKQTNKQTSKQANKQTHIYIYMYIYIYIHTYIHTYIHANIHTYTHTYVHIYTHYAGVPLRNPLGAGRTGTCRHRLNGFLAQLAPRSLLVLEAVLRCVEISEVLKGMLPWRTRYPLSKAPVQPVTNLEQRVPGLSLAGILGHA